MSVKPGQAQLHYRLHYARTDTGWASYFLQP